MSVMQRDLRQSIIKDDLMENLSEDSNRLVTSKYKNMQQMTCF